MFGKPTPPNTVSDDQWWQLQKAAAKAVPLIEGPWCDPAALAKKHAWEAAPGHADDN